MKNEIIYTSSEKIKPKLTTHNIGKKFVLATKDQCESNITQIAKGILGENHIIEPHFHPTMEEFYYFLSGEAVMCIDNSEFKCQSGTFIKIPANGEHNLKPITQVSFLYWGIAI